MPSKTGLLLVNVGTPASPEPRDVGAYLREFLMDPLVIDIPYIARWPLVNLGIVPRRKHA
ncbi:ferrochelatase, partial [bacterium]|nr:ferrochelatase [bacterium]